VGTIIGGNDDGDKCLHKVDLFMLAR